jgi:hypothetical protein
MDTWLTILLIVAVVAPLAWFATRRNRRRERAEFEAPEDIFDAPAGRSAASSSRGSRSPDHDRQEGDAADGGGDGGGD